MKLFLHHLKDHLPVAVTYLLFCLIFGVSFYLYDLPLGAVVYPALLCAVIGLIVFSLDYSHTYRKHKQLCQIQRMTAAMIDHLPQARTTDDADYQAIIMALKGEVLALENSTSRRYREMVDYYTVWAHQIKTPIASMRLTLQNNDSELSRAASADLFRIEQYVEMVLAFLRLGSDSSDYVFKEHLIDDIVKRSVKKFSTEFINRRLRLEYDLTEETVITDEKWLAFVIEQLLSNALKYTREGCIRISIKKPKLLYVQDTGIGIAPEDLPRIFEKGYTGYNGRLDAKSSGIGLYLCKRICDNLGIGINVTSEVGKGTTVILDLNQNRTPRD